jgi:hypothetical protein
MHYLQNGDYRALAQEPNSRRFRGFE